MNPTFAHLLDRVTIIAQTLNPGRLQARIDEWTRGGLPATSLPTGSRGADPPMPAFDQDDRHFRRLAHLYRQALTAAAEQLEIARRIELIVVPPHKTDRKRYGLYRAEASRQAAEDHGPQSAECVNCGRLVARTAADRFKASRCSACYQYRHTHGGTDRPRQLWEREL